MTIKTSVFVNIFLFTIIDDATRKRQKTETYKSIEKKMKRIFLTYENESIYRSFEFFSFRKFLASFYDDYLYK